MVNDFDLKIKLNPTNNILWEPMWQTSTRMLEVEQKILALRYLKRLHFIHHGGGSYLNTHYIHTRMQHTMGVYSLVAYFEPENINLRIAALLHDVGHPPFSHTTEKINGIDHHILTEEIILNSEVTEILNEYKLPGNLIMDLIEGRESSILNNKKGYLHLDHLDSWVRSGYAGGNPKVIPKDILKNLSIANGYIETNEETAQLLFDIILDEARLHCSFLNLISNAVIQHMVEELINSKVIDINDLKFMIDSELEYILLNNAKTKELAQKLWFQIDKFKITKDKNLATEAYILTEIKKLYLSMPLVNGVPFDALNKEAKNKIHNIENLKGKYYIY